MRYLSLLLVVGALSCGGGDGEGEAQPGGTTIGPEGGTIESAEGVKLVVPAGALDEPIAFEITMTDKTPGSLPETFAGISRVAEIEPSGTIFKVPVTLIIPWDRSALPDDHGEDSVFVYSAPSSEGPWEAVPTTIQESSLLAEITHLSSHVGASGCLAEGHGCDATRYLLCCDALGLECIGDTCSACRKEGQAASNGFDCCDGYQFEEGKCLPCKSKGKPCTHTADCCNMSATGCIDGVCADCLTESSPCGNYGACCGSLKCVGGVCAKECGHTGEGCLGSSDCCGWAPPTRVECVGGVCTACGNLGVDCNASGITCCGNTWCMEGQCAKCQGEGAYCPYNHACCNNKCEGDVCVSCLKTWRPCNKASDCCSGVCDKHKCDACPDMGITCGTDADCCPGECCSGGKRTCFENTCQDCELEGAACAFDSDCCGTSQCFNGVCGICREVGEGCNLAIAGHCCVGAICSLGICEACVGLGESCADKPCCFGPCMNDICQECLPHGDQCENNVDCCSKVCENGACFQCSAWKEACDAVNTCCGEFLECKGGICELTCAFTGEACGAGGMDCCPDLDCEAGVCVQNCTSEGDECDEDDDCCSGLKCFGGDCEDENMCIHEGNACTQDTPCCEGLYCEEGTCKKDAPVAPEQEAICDIAWNQYSECNMGDDTKEEYLVGCKSWYDSYKATWSPDCFAVFMNHRMCMYGLSCADYQAGGEACDSIKDTNPAGCPEL